jgi:diguanylate cyclase (GGDEF)-like protein/PAS domain S-box-containing protein
VVVAAAAALFALAFALRLVVGDDTSSPVLLVAVLPVAILSAELGLVAAMVGTLIALTMLIAWVEIDDVSFGWLDWAWRIAIFPVLALIAAVLGQRVRDTIAAARRSRERLLQVISTAHEGYISMDGDGTITAWNPEAEAIFGWRAEEAIGRPVADMIVPPPMRAEHIRGLKRFLATGEAPMLDRRIELEGLHRDGHTLPVELTISAIEEDDGWTFHAFLHEITDRKRTERELRNHVADLGAVIDATRELARSTDAASARMAICDGAREVSGGQAAILWQPDPGGVGLRASAAAGADVEGILLPFVGEPAGAVRAFSTGDPFFVADVVGNPAVVQTVVEQTEAASALWQPVLREGNSIGVLTVVWQSPIEEISPRVARVMELLAAEATVAIERAGLLARLENMARTDDLTGLPNRRSWDEELPRELARGTRYSHPVCVAMLDLDRFKDYNDRLGHLAGDRLLKEAAGAWRGALRDTDRLARYGGEEFSVVLPDCALEDAGLLVERLRSVTPVGETCSAGVVEWDGEESPEGLVRRADAALYEAKRTGRDRTVAVPLVSDT